MASDGRRARRSPGFLVIRVVRNKRDHDVYFVSPDALGEPVRSEELNKLINAYTRSSEKAATYVDFAEFVDFSDGLNRLLGGQGKGEPQLGGQGRGRHRFGGQGHAGHRPPRRSPPRKRKGRARK